MNDWLPAECSKSKIKQNKYIFRLFSLHNSLQDIEIDKMINTGDTWEK